MKVGDKEDNKIETMKDKNTEAFDKILPGTPQSIGAQIVRFPYVNKYGLYQVISLDQKCKYSLILFKAFVIAFSGDQFLSLTEQSKSTYFDIIRKFFEWLSASGYIFKDISRFDVFKEYEKYYLNDLGLKSSPVGILNSVVGESLSGYDLDEFSYNYIKGLIAFSVPNKVDSPVSKTLSSWFELPWLRSIIGEDAYLQLESPKLLLKSFRITIATTLLYLLDIRDEWNSHPGINFDTSCKNWIYDWNSQLINKMVKFDEHGRTQSYLGASLVDDLVKTAFANEFKDMMVNEFKKNKRPISRTKLCATFAVPVFFHPNYIDKYSEVEELLCSWLVACEGIQPSDIHKLKINNYARECSKSGRLIALQCKYYKGRSGALHQPNILLASDSWTQALDAYLCGLNSVNLFNIKSCLIKHTSFSSYSTILGFIYKIWNQPSFKEKLNRQLSRGKSTTLFLDAYSALEYSDKNYYRIKNDVKSRENLKESRPLPKFIFTLTHIKNTAVHAGTDNYRVSDLVNFNSHSSNTEKLSYLTDSNKDWVNKSGRITRIVLQDLQDVVFQPSISKISQSIKDLELRTKISNLEGVDEIKIHGLRSNPIERNDANEIVVIDTLDAALYFIHYISQAEKYLPDLIRVRPDYVRLTLIIQVEWMTKTLTRMRATSNAYKVYKTIASNLPQIFDYLLDTIE